MTEEFYSRQESLNLNINQEIIIVGCGGTGSWLAFFACLSGVKTITLFDFDHFEASNFGRIPLPPTYVNQNKAQAVKHFLETYRDDLFVTAMGRADSFSLDSVLGSIIFDCTDNSAIQDFLVGYCRTKGKTYIRCGYNGGEHITLTDTGNGFSTDESEVVTGYEIVPSWVIPAALPSALAIFKLLRCPTFRFSGTISSIDQGLSSPVHSPRKSLSLNDLINAHDYLNRFEDPPEYPEDLPEDEEEEDLEEFEELGSSSTRVDNVLRANTRITEIQERANEIIRSGMTFLASIPGEEFRAYPREGGQGNGSSQPAKPS